MNRLRIVAAEDDPFVQDYYAQVLPALGHEVLAIVDSGWELIERCSQLQPDLVITDIKMPDMDGIDAAHKLYWEQPLPIIIVSGFHDEELIQRAASEHILAYLLKPVTMERLRTEIELAMRRFTEFQAVLSQTDDLRQALKDRKLIERAKAILMRDGLAEEQAFSRIHSESVQQGSRLVQVAQLMLSHAEAL